MQYTQATLLIAVISPLPSPPLPPSLYIPPPVDRRDDIPESEIRGTWVDPAEAVPEIAPMTVGEVNNRTQSLLRRPMSLSDITGTRLPLALLEAMLMLAATVSPARRPPSELSQTIADLVYSLTSTLSLPEATSDTATAVGYSHSDTALEMSDMQAELLALREQQRRARQPGLEARIPDRQDASGDADSHI
ncbi:hypothetical protein Tco_0139296 [Tanacetum coccineum]